MSKKKDAAQVFDEIITSGEEIIVSGNSILSCLEVLIKAAKELKEIFFIPTQAALPEKTEIQSSPPAVVPPVPDPHNRQISHGFPAPAPSHVP